VQWATETEWRREQDDLERRAERHERAIETAARLEELGSPRLSIKVLFLDIDGVLVNRWSLMQASGCQAPFAPACLTALNRILRETTAQIVVTSVWRTEFSELRRSSLQHLLTVKGVAGTVLDSTPVLRGQARVDEISQWLDEYERYPIKSFVILDDEGGMGSLSAHLVQTRHEIGLTEYDADRAVNILGENRPEGHI
jgi:DNA-binding LacI/PurR family transcriptional regulator